jgi:hypothetical protein
MNIATALQNLQFLSEQAKKYRKKGSVSDEDMYHFANEVDQFKKDAKHSDLPKHLKKDISELDLSFTDTKTSAGYFMMGVSAIVLGAAVSVFFLSRRSKRRAFLELLDMKAEILSDRIAEGLRSLDEITESDEY